jgi:hypothetical protein
VSYDLKTQPALVWLKLGFNPKDIGNLDARGSRLVDRDAGIRVVRNDRPPFQDHPFPNVWIECFRMLADELLFHCAMLGNLRRAILQPCAVRGIFFGDALRD